MTSPRLVLRITIAATALAAAACSQPAARARPRPAAGPSDFTVMTYNVNFGIGGDPDTIAAIRAGAADVVLLQETTPRWEEALRDALAAEYPHMAFRHCCRAGGLAILSRFPFEEREYVPAPSGWFPAWRVIVATPGGDVQMLNVHLHPKVSESGSWVSGYFTTGGVRRDEIAAFAATLEDDLPAIVAGDFNEQPGEGALAWLADRGLRSALPELAGDRTTWLGDQRRHAAPAARSPGLRQGAHRAGRARHRRRQLGSPAGRRDVPDRRQRSASLRNFWPSRLSLRPPPGLT
jgi:endonuclease/exonuclease/phosphatase (EEP) superfamily protein YafD